MSWAGRISFPGTGGIIEILVLACLFYFVIRFFRGTPGAQVLFGLVMLLVALMGLTRVFNLDALNWLLRQFSVYLAVALLIIFQPEVRRALAEIGRQHLFTGTSEPRTMVDNIVQAVQLLAQRRVGALIAVEREIGTRGIQETGIKLDSRVTAELLASIFFPHTPLHDGGVIVSANRIVAAGCLFPLTQRPDVSKRLGTRHRAAIGLTEETDAVVVVVSEETGTISVSYRGRLSKDLDEERLRRFLSALLVKPKTVKNRWARRLPVRPPAAAPAAAAAGANKDEEGDSRDAGDAAID